MKKEEQDKLIAWSNKMCEPSYPDALMAIEQIVSDRKDLRFRSWMLDEAILRGIEFTSVPTQMDMVIEALKGKDKKARQEQLRLPRQLSKPIFRTSGWNTPTANWPTRGHPSERSL